MKLCYCNNDAAIRDYRRRVLIDSLTGPIDEVVADGVATGALHSRHPGSVGRLLLLLACDVNDEACGILAADLNNPDRMIRVIELLNGYRESAELLAGAPYGSLWLFEPGRLVSLWDAAVEELKRLEDA